MIVALAVLSFLSFALTVWRWLAGRLYLRERASESHRSIDLGRHRSVTLLKPLKGLEADSRKCLESWVAQDYPAPVQILFGVASADDPVCGLVRELLAKHPKLDAELVICPELLAPNRKVSTLMQLEGRIRNEVIVISDADVSVPPDFLVRTVPILEREGVGLVHSFYRLANPSTLAMRWEALGVNADFWSEVLQARGLKEIDFALGATMVLECSTLRDVGGFAALAPFLADDYQLGQAVSKAGKKIAFSPFVVDCWETSQGFGQVLKHQLRWARTIRVCQPLPVFFSILNNATLWPILLCAIFPAGWTGAVCGAFLTFRVMSAADLQCRLTGSRSGLPYAWMALVKDALNVIIWGLSFLGNTIEWRGERFRVRAGGKLEKA